MRTSAQYINESMDNVVLSLDGRREVNDEHPQDRRRHGQL